MNADRIKAPLLAFIRSALSRIDYYAAYKAKVVSQSADGTKVDLVPEDQRLPSMSGVPLKVGLPGTVTKVSPGAFLFVSWDGGDPRKPFAEWGADSSEAVTLIEIGGVAAQFVALSNLVANELTSIALALSTHTHSGVTVGAGITGTSTSSYSAGDVAATKVKVA